MWKMPVPVAAAAWLSRGWHLFARGYLTNGVLTAAFSLGSLTVLTLVAHLCTVLQTLLLTQTLGAEQFGAFVLAVTVQSFLAKFGGFGTNAIVVREGAQRPERIQVLMTSHLLITAGASLLALFLTAGVTGLAPVTADERLLIIMLAVGNVFVCANIRSFFDIVHQPSTSAALVVGFELAGLIALWVLMTCHTLTSFSLGMVFLCKWALVTLAHYLVWHRTQYRIRWWVSASNIGLVMSSAWLLMLSGVITRVPFALGVLLVRMFHSSAETGVLGIALQVANGYLLMLGLAGRVLQPHLARPYGIQPAFMRKLIVCFCLYAGLLLLAVQGTAWLLIVTLLDPVYHAALRPAAMLLVAGFLFSVGGICQCYLTVFRQEALVAVLTSLAGIGYLVIGVVLIPQFSYIGAALATLVITGLSTGYGLYRVYAEITRRRAVHFSGARPWRATL